MAGSIMASRESNHTLRPAGGSFNDRRAARAEEQAYQPVQCIGWSQTHRHSAVGAFGKAPPLRVQ